MVFLLGLDEIDHNLLENAFVVYLGHHGDSSASIADVVLPSPAYTERSSTYMNIEGRVIQTSRCHNPLGEAKEEWKIYRVLSNLLDKENKFNNLSDVRHSLINSNQQFRELLELPKRSGITFASKSEIKNYEFSYNIKNFYMNDSISRASETMAKCSKDILKKVA